MINCTPASFLSKFAGRSLRQDSIQLQAAYSGKTVLKRQSEVSGSACNGIMTKNQTSSLMIN